MIELLIQLRTPKLSKDFKPSVINEILSRSLQTLSEDDLRPMSEAIENMDNLKTNLDTLNDSVHAAQQIEKAYNQYNEIVLYDKALLLANQVQECRKLEKKAKELVYRKEESDTRLKEESERYEALKREEEIVRKESDSLRDSDAARLKQQEVAMEKECLEMEKEVEKKNGQEQEKKDRYLETERKLKEQQSKNEQIWDTIETSLEEMENVLADVAFDEFVFFKNELLENREQEYSFSGHNQLFTDYKKRVESGKQILQEERNCQQRYDRYLQEADEYRSRQEQKERECRQYENQLHETKNETIEKFCKWEKENQQLHLDDESKQKIIHRMEQYRWGEDYSEIRDIGKGVFYEKEREFQYALSESEKEKQRIEQEYQKIKEELEEWRTKKDPEPECSEAVKQNREMLVQKGIPFLQFYKTIDFCSQMSEEQAGKLEEALLTMGVLDALIVPSEYRDRVRALDTGVCDRYIFSDVAHVKQNLSALLDVNNEENDILKYQSVANILSSIGVLEDGQVAEAANTWVDADGNYRIGVVEGTVTREYQARYIGVRAREKFRQEKIEQLEQEKVLWERQLEECESKIQKLHEELKQLQYEWNSFPGDVDLKTAAKEYADKSYELDCLNEQFRKVREQMQQVKEELDNIQLRVREICSKCYLTARLDVFEQALEALTEYKELLTQVQVNHGHYHSGTQYVKALQENLEAIDADLDEIRYEQGRAV